MFPENPEVKRVWTPVSVVFWRVAQAIGVLMVPVFLITMTVRLVATAPPLYEYGFARYSIPQVTGFTLDQLLSAAEQTRTYFRSDEEPLKVVVRRNGEPMDLYNEREVAHMADVKALFNRIRRVEEVAGAYLLGMLGLGLWMRKAAYLAEWLRMLQLGCILTGGLVLATAAGALFAFDQLFLQFHLFSFTNTLWLLDPTRDYLLMMYPAGFFRDAALAVGGLSLMEATLVAWAASFLLAYLERLRQLPTPATVEELQEEEASPDSKPD